MTSNEIIPLESTGERYLPGKMDGDIAAEHLHRYLFAARHVAGRRVLDVACGEGYGSAELARYATEVIGIDVDPAAVAHAQATYPRDNLSFQLGHAAELPLADASVDVVVSFETIEHHDHHDAMLAEIRRVLRPGGLLILSSPDRVEYSEKPGYRNPFHVKELDRAELDVLIQRYFPHRRYLGQRLSYGSLLRPYGEAGDPAPLHIEQTWHPMYWVVLASDDPAALPKTADTLYLADLEQSRPVQQARQAIASIEHQLNQTRAELERQLNQTRAELERQRDDLEHQLNQTQAELERQRDDLERQLNQAKAELESQHNAQRDAIRRHAILSHRTDNPRWLFARLLGTLAHQPKRLLQARAERQRIATSGLFDPAWYLQHNPDVASAGIDPLRHYHQTGGYEGRAASPRFDSLDHLLAHPELLESRRHPLLDHLDRQAAAAAENNALLEGERRLYRQIERQTAPSPSGHIGFDPAAAPPESRIRAIAFYLPQFHPIPENDRWWGKGFTEWTNVGKAIPQFEGHDQPRLPGELGYYDLRLPEVQRRQVELARHYGISAFCFHYYWFSGKRLLERPIDQFVADPEIRFPFCLCWANENWTRRWDGQENDVLIAQGHRPEDDLAFIQDIAPLLEHPDYLRIDGRPLLLVYRVDQLPDPARTARIWREYARERGLGEPYLVSALSFANTDPRPAGFDATVEFPPHQTVARCIEDELTFLNPEFSGQVYDFPDLVSTQLTKPPVPYRRYRTVAPGWDNSARKPGRGHIFARATPGRYQQWLAGALREADTLPGGEKLVFINAWNEWAEGAYLEPDRRWGYAYLEATRRALAARPHSAPPAPTAAPPREHDTAIVLHLYHHDLWDEIAANLEPLHGEFDLYVTLDAGRDHQAVVERIRASHPRARIRPLPNRGRDILPLLTLLREIQHAGYTAVCKIHSKRSTHRGDGDTWRRALISALLEDPARIRRAFAADPSLGMVGPAGHWIPTLYYWTEPADLLDLRALLDRLGVLLGLAEVNFFAGSMFWFRPEALAPLLTFDETDFPPERGQIDGTLAHRIERVFAAVVIAGGWRVTDTAHPEAAAEPAPVHPYPFAKARTPPEEYAAEPGLRTTTQHVPAPAPAGEKLRHWLYAHPRLHAALRPPYRLWQRLKPRNGRPTPP